MPRSVFRLLWQTIEAKGEFFGYVQNMATNGDHYWVFAHVTPSFDAAGNMVGFHSNRRRPDPAQIARIEPVYRRLLDEEARHGDRRQGLEAGFALFQSCCVKRACPMTSSHSLSDPALLVGAAALAGAGARGRRGPRLRLVAAGCGATAALASGAAILGLRGMRAPSGAWSRSAAPPTPATWSAAS
jgi:hypothetical protein